MYVLIHPGTLLSLHDWVKYFQIELCYGIAVSIVKLLAHQLLPDWSSGVARAPLSTVVITGIIRYVAMKLLSIFAEFQMIFFMLQLISVFGKFWANCGV